MSYELKFWPRHYFSVFPYWCWWEWERKGGNINNWLPVSSPGYFLKIRVEQSRASPSNGVAGRSGLARPVIIITLHHITPVLCTAGPASPAQPSPANNIENQQNICINLYFENSSYWWYFIMFIIDIYSRKVKLR